MNAILVLIVVPVRIALKAPAVCVNVRTESVRRDRSVVPTLMVAVNAAVQRIAPKAKNVRTVRVKIHRLITNVIAMRIAGHAKIAQQVLRDCVNVQIANALMDRSAATT